MRETYCHSLLPMIVKVPNFYYSRAKANASIFQYNVYFEKLTLQKYNVYFIYARDVNYKYRKKKNISIARINIASTLFSNRFIISTFILLAECMIFIRHATRVRRFAVGEKLPNFSIDFFCEYWVNLTIFIPATFI